jgi:hypothetical protein
MKKLTAIVIPLALFLMSSPAAYPQAKQTASTPPPVAPDLVREGDFAIRLVSGLEIGTVENETEAETMLASAGIAPKNGWISDYPVTPDILGELEDAVAAAADSNRLSMDKSEALEALASVSADLGLSVVADTSGEYAEAPPPASPPYTQPPVINNYYSREGPPVVTYYPPPPDYLYLYAWVPYPFWCSRFFFSGFFILRDFHKVSIIHKRVVVVSNHFFHRGHRRFFRVDPLKRRGGKSWTAVARRTYGRPLFTAEARRGARSILQRSHDRLRSSTGLVDRNSAVLKSPIGSAGISRTKTARQMPPFNGRTGVKVQTSPRQNIQRAHKNAANPFTALGNNQGRSPGPHTSRGRDSSGTAQQIPALDGRTEVRAKTSPGQEVQRARRDSTRVFRAPGRSAGKSSSSLPSMGGRGFPGGSHGGSRGFSGKSSRNHRGADSALKGFSRVPFQ